MIKWRSFSVLIGFGLLNVFSGISHALSDTNQSPASDIGNYQQHISKAQQLLNDYELRHALEVLQSARELAPDNPEADYWIGETYFQMQRYTEAANSFNRVIASYPTFWPARHRRWLTMLARDDLVSATKVKIEKEISKVIEQHEDDVEALYCAYRGYYSLRKKTERIELLQRLVPLANMEAKREDIAASLLEEMLISREYSLRVRLGELYLQEFADQRDIRLASLIYLRSATKIESRSNLSPDVYLARFPENRHLKYAVAEELLRANADIELADRLLREHRIALLSANHEKQWYQTEKTWEILRGRERAQADYLFGIMYKQRGRFIDAYLWFTKALLHHPKPGRIYLELARLAWEEGKLNSAINYYKQAAMHGSEDKEVDKELSNRLAEINSGWTDPRLYFARQENIVTFADVTRQMGLEQVSSERVAWGDYNGDGFDDLLLDGPRLFRNDQGKQFIEITNTVGLSKLTRTKGGTWADFDDDGLLDIFVTTPATNYLLRNEFGDRFLDVTEEVFGVENIFNGRTEAAAWGDLNNDGWLDLYLANYEKRGLARGVCYRDQLFVNSGNGRLCDYTYTARVMTDTPLCGRGVVWSDINDDGWQDILVANYRLQPNLLWLNDGFGHFIERARKYGIRGANVEGAFGHTIGIAVGDVSNDGIMDLYISNLAHPRYLDFSDQSHLLIVHEDGLVEQAEKSGIQFEETSADPSFADVDNDGDLDLYVTSIYPGRSSHLYRNEGKGQFTDITWLSNTRVENAWGAAFSDFDNDGDLDLLVASSEAVRLLRNDGNDNKWLQVRINSRKCNRFGIGSRIRLSSSHSVQVREVRAGRGTGSQDSITAHFGLGGDDHQDIELEVRELCGGITKLQQVQLNQKVSIR